LTTRSTFAITVYSVRGWSMPKTCRCARFQNSGICYHTAPAAEVEAREKIDIPPPELPALKRMRKRRIHPYEAKMLEAQGDLTDEMRTRVGPIE
jgi:hypothetical protein